MSQRPPTIVATVGQTPLAKPLMAWFPDHARVRITSVPPGLSGDEVFRVECLDDGECYALKASHWDAKRASRATTIERVIHDSSRSCAALTPCVPTRAARSTHVHVIGDIAFRCFPWREGESISGGASRASIKTCMTTIASVHSALAGIPVDRTTSRAWASGTRRQHRQRLDRIRETLSASGVPRHCPGPLGPAIDEAYWCLHDAVRSGRCDGWRHQLDDLETQRNEGPSQWILKDLHCDNILLNQCDGSVAIIDHDAAAVDVPAVDVARCLGSVPRLQDQFQSASDAMAWAAAEYRRIRPFSTAEQDLAELLMVSGWLGSLANWVVWTNQEQRVFAWSDAALASRISELAGRFRSLAGSGGPNSITYESTL
ncbi:MAG: phosphotransferase [Planctomycetota bacterium]